MSITPFLRDEPFDPELLETMAAAFSQSCNALGLSDRVDPLTELVARHIVEAAQCGMRTKTALYMHTMSEFKAHPH